MESNEVRLNKIPLKKFIDALVNIYRTGADFIDIIGKADVQQDSIGIIVKESYMSSDDEPREDGDDYDDYDNDNDNYGGGGNNAPPIDLSNPDDINQLL